MHLNCRCCDGVKNDSLDLDKSNRTLSYGNPAMLFLLLKLALEHLCRPILNIIMSLATIWECHRKRCLLLSSAARCSNGTESHADSPKSALFTGSIPGAPFAVSHPITGIVLPWCHRRELCGKGVTKAGMLSAHTPHCSVSNSGFPGGR